MKIGPAMAKGWVPLFSGKEICDTTFAMEENQALGFENERAAENILSGQCIEGISAFLEKRAPKWKS